MAWEDQTAAIVRTLIQDVGATPTYTDARLNQLVLVTAPLLQLMASFAAAYAADPVAGTLTPDPTLATPPDNDFVALVCLMAAKNLVAAEIKDYARQGIDIQDGDSRIKLARDPNTLRVLKQEYDQMFADALYAYKTGGDAGLGQIIVGPYKYLANPQWGAGGLFEGYPGGRTGSVGLWGTF